MNCKNCASPMMPMSPGKRQWMEACLKCGTIVETEPNANIKPYAAQLAFSGWNHMQGSQFDAAEEDFRRAAKEGGRSEHLWAALLAKYGVRYGIKDKKYTPLILRRQPPKEPLFTSAEFQDLCDLVAPESVERLLYYRREAREIDSAMASPSVAVPESLKEPAPRRAPKPGGTLRNEGAVWDEDEEYIDGDSSYVPGNPNLPRASVNYIHFMSNCRVTPKGAWDMSEQGNGSVIGWTEQSEGGCTLYIASEGKLYLGADCEMQFAGFENLQEIHFDGHVDTSKVSDMTRMFADCYALRVLDLKGFDMSQVRTVEGMFESCGRLKVLRMNGFDTPMLRDMNRMFWDCESLEELDLSSFDTSKVVDMSDMFFQCSSLARVNLSNFRTQEVTTMFCMFFGCHRLAELDLRGFDTSKVRNMACMFGECASLTSLDLSCFDTSNVTEMYNMFLGCTSLIELNVSSFNTSKVKIMNSMFEGCCALTSLDLSSFNTSQGTYVHRMFSICPDLKVISVSKGFRMDGRAMEDMFAGGGTPLIRHD